jgi:hypothetical protein
MKEAWSLSDAQRRQERPLLSLVIVLGLALLACWALLYHADLWSFPQQLEPTEGGLMMSTRAVLEGKDPWAVTLAPMYSNNYGIGFPWAAAALSRWAPRLPLLQVLRMVSALCIFMVLGLFYLTWRDQGLGILTSMAGCLAVYIPLLFLDIPAGRPDMLAVLLYVGSLLAVLRPGVRAAILAGALPALGYFVKPYALLGWGLGALHLARHGRWAHLGAFVGSGLASFLALTVFVLHGHPYYFDGTLFALADNLGYSLNNLLGQGKVLLRCHFPLASVALGAAWQARRQGFVWKPVGAALDWGYFSALSLAVLAAGPGLHHGAYLRYFDELFIPVALVFFVLWAHQLGVTRWLLLLALLGNSLLCGEYHHRSCYTVSAQDYAGWIQADQWMEEHPRGIYPPLMTELAVRHHAYVIDTDHSRFLRGVKPFGKVSPLATFATERLQWYLTELTQGRMQTVVCGAYWPCPLGLELMGYHEVEPICLRTPLTRGVVCFSVYVPDAKQARHNPQVLNRL